MTEWTRFLLRVAGYGFLLLLIAMIGLFIMSMILGTDQPIDYPVAVIAVALLLGASAFWCIWRIKPETKNEAILYGTGWSLVVATILLTITIPNGTTETVFGSWATYLLFLSIPAGAWVAKSN